MIWLTLCLAAISLLVLVKMVRAENFWKRKKVVHKSTWPLVGDLRDVVLRRRNVGYVVEELYKRYPDKRYYGTYMFTVPCLVIKDLELIKKVMVKDFDHFVDHINVTDSEQEPVFGRNLMALKGEKWRTMRSTLSPSFSGNKIRIMFRLISDCAKQLNDHFSKRNEEIIEVEAKDLMSRVAVDIIATTAFGLQCDSIGKDSEFYKMGMLITKAGLMVFLRGLIQIVLPRFAKIFKISQLSSIATKFFEDVIRKTLKRREENNIIRPDMIHILMEAKKAKKTQEDPNKSEISIEDIVAQGFLFFLAGFETVSTLLAHICNELALNPSVQEKVRQEIDVHFGKNYEDVNYETLIKMKYLDMVVLETLRKWPPSAFTNRECVLDYKIEASELHGEEELTIGKGVGIIVPTFGIHRDPKYYPDPEKFDPERFGDENKRNVDNFAFLPFGIGPRNCIGSRLALLEAKVLTAYLLSKFEIVTVKKTQIPLVLSSKKPGLVPDRFWLGLKKRRGRFL